MGRAFRVYAKGKPLVILNHKKIGILIIGQSTIVLCQIVYFFTALTNYGHAFYKQFVIKENLIC